MSNRTCCVIYARQSFGQEQDSTSIAVQLDECRRWAKAHGMQIAGEYSDAQTSSEHYPLCEEGVEASRIDRGYQRWLREQRTQGRKQYEQGLGEAFQRIAKDGVSAPATVWGGRRTVQSFSMTLINGHRRLVAPRQGSYRMDTLGCGYNAS